MANCSDIAKKLCQHTSYLLERDPAERLQSIRNFIGLIRKALHTRITPNKRAALLSEAYEILQQETTVDVAAQVMSALPQIEKNLALDIDAAFVGDPAANSYEEVIESFPSTIALIHHRIAHELYKANERRLARFIGEAAHSTTGIDIHPGANIGHGFFIDHGTGVVIGETAIIGNNVRIYQGVTLGAKSFQKNADGTLVKGEPRHPIVEDDVIIYAHATILGRIRIGKGSVIGGNVWVTSDVPAGTRVFQTVAKREVFRGYGDGI